MRSDGKESRLFFRITNRIRRGSGMWLESWFFLSIVRLEFGKDKERGNKEKGIPICFASSANDADLEELLWQTVEGNIKKTQHMHAVSYSFFSVKFTHFFPSLIQELLLLLMMMMDEWEILLCHSHADTFAFCQVRSVNCSYPMYSIDRMSLSIPGRFSW